MHSLALLCLLSVPTGSQVIKPADGGIRSTVTGCVWGGGVLLLRLCFVVECHCPNTAINRALIITVAFMLK